MPRPSQYAHFTGLPPTATWLAIERHWDNSFTTSPLERNNWDLLKSVYIRKRRGDSGINIGDLKINLPTALMSAKIGESDYDFLDILLNYQTNRFACITGTRGVGKTSFIHYNEQILNLLPKHERPIFIILDCFGIRENFESIYNDISTLAFTEISKLQEKLEESDFARINSLLPNKNERSNFNSLRIFISELQKNFSSSIFDRLVFIFDNLDQLPISVASEIINATIALRAVAPISSIISLRDNYDRALRKRSDAMAMYRLTINLTPPRFIDWFDKLVYRIQQQIEHTDPGYVIVDGKRSSGIDVRNYLSRLARNSTGARRFDDSIADLLDAVSADDIRRLGLLTRRMLSHHSLPSMNSVTGRSAGFNFHPLPAIIQGNSSVYEDNRIVPNIFVSYNEENSFADYLLCQRVLLFIGNFKYIYTPKLTNMLMMLGYEERGIWSCLKKLSESLLIRPIDRVKFDDDAPPSRFHITAAGNFYIDNLLHNPDYMLSVTFDIDLQHTELSRFLRSRKKIDGLEVPVKYNLSSAMEYIDLIADKEKEQLRRLSTATIDNEKLYWELVATIHHYGSFSKRLISTLQQFIRRTVTSSRSKKMRNLTEAILEEWIPSRENLAREIEEILKSRIEELKYDNLSSGSVVRQHYQDEVSDLNMRWLNLTDHIDIEYSRFRSNSKEILMSFLFKSVHGTQFRAVRLDKDSDLESQRTMFKGTLKDVACPSGEIPKLESSETISLDQRSEKNVGMLALNEDVLLPSAGSGGSTHRPFVNGISLEFHDFNTAHELVPEKVGEINDLEEFEPNIRGKIEQLNAKAVSNQLSYRDIRDFGAWLATKILIGNGENYFISNYQKLETVLLCSAREEMVIPWEWLNPRQQRGKANFPVLCDAARTIRSTTGVARSAWTLSKLDEESIPKSFATFGLSLSDKDLAWRRSTRTIDELYDEIAEFDIVHIVGHYNVEDQRLEIETPDDEIICLTLDNIIGTALGKPGQVLILSACEVGMATEPVNLGMTIASTSNCSVWCPVLKVTKSFCLDLDLRLSEIIGQCSENSTQIFRELRDQFPLAYAYIRFGM